MQDTGGTQGSSSKYSQHRLPAEWVRMSTKHRLAGPFQQQVQPAEAARRAASVSAHLGGSSSMHSCHQPLLNAKVLMDHLQCIHPHLRLLCTGVDWQLLPAIGASRCSQTLYQGGHTYTVG